MSQKKHKEDRARLREAREAAEAADARRARRALIAKRAGIVAACLVAIAGIVALVALSKKPVEVTGVSETRAMFAGIPQEGLVLGDPDAPALMDEFVDIQCPFCAEFAEEGLPYLVENYVRTGKLRIRLQLLTFLGKNQTPNDSERAARFVLAAAEQGKGLDAAEILFRSQGLERSGWVTDELLREIATAIDGLDVERVMRDRSKAEYAQRLRQTSQLADKHKIQGTPSFVITKDGKTEQLHLDRATREQLDALFGG